VDLSGYEIILIDDVKTSGATLSACTRLLKQAGARGIHAAVVAVADPKGQGFRTT
jgi:predicted amidophosphoribosyltransferase